MSAPEFTYQDHYESAISPTRKNLRPSLLGELRNYLNLTTDDESLHKICREAPEKIFSEWKKQKIDPANKEQVTSFYVNTDLYVYELLGLEIDATEYRQKQLKHFAAILKQNGKLKGCDYGSGIGTLGIYLNQNGIKCDFADVSDLNLNFIAKRLKARNISGPKTINLMREKLPSGQYDFVTAFDVIEHVADPLSLIKEITDKLNVDGLFIFNLLYHDEKDTPHILMNPYPIRKNLRGFGLKKVTSIGEFKVYQKVERPLFGNAIMRGFDTAFWTFRANFDRMKKAFSN